MARLRWGSNYRLEDLLVSTSRGDSIAFEEFFQQTQLLVVSYLGRILFDKGSVNDLAQEVYLRTWRSSGSFDPSHSAKTWLLSIAHNVAIDHLRKRSPAVTTLVDSAAVASKGDFTAVVDLWGAVDSLDLELRSAFVLTSVLGFSYADAALICGCGLGALKSRLFRARSILMKLLSETERPDESKYTSGGIGN
ncbi:MAG: RNA polymerase sigma factor [Acidimicrobiaceae bacterium]|nr:RNA polymerase sigma factor [Acidimicrobiaceae bacterium]